MSRMLGECELMLGRRKSSYIFAVEVAEFDGLTFFYCNRPMLTESTLVRSVVRGAPAHTATYIPGIGALCHHGVPVTLKRCEASLQCVHSG